MRQWTVIILGGALVFGACGGASESGSDEPVDTEPVADTSGDEVAPDEPVEAVEPEARSGPGQIRVVNRIGGEDSTGTVRVLDEAGEVVAEGTSGDTFNVPSGSYRVVGEITDAAVMIDTPSHELDGLATVPAGETYTAHVDFPVSRILVQVRRANRPLARWTLQLQREGRDEGETIELSPSSSHVAITPGRYGGMLRFGASQIEVSGLIFQGGATMTVPVNVD